MRRIEIGLLIGTFFASACGSSSPPPSSNGGSAGEAGRMQGNGGMGNGSPMGGTSTGGTPINGGNAGAAGAIVPGGAASAGGTPTGSGGAASGGVAAASGNGTGGGASGAPGSAGGGAAAGSAGAGTGKSACEKALFCDDFEKYPAGKAPSAPFTTQMSAGLISVDEMRHVSGSRSVKFTTEGKAGTKTAFLRLEANNVFPIAGNAYYGRMMFFLESAPTAAVHWTFIQGGGKLPGQTYRALYRYGGQHPVLQNNVFAGNQLMANYETPDSYAGNGPRSDCWHHANQRVVPAAKWSCVEWKFDGPTNQMQLWLDGAPADDLTVNGVGQGCVAQPATFAWTAPNFEYLELGWESYQDDAARTLFIDDLVISREPIGCP